MLTNSEVNRTIQQVVKSISAVLGADVMVIDNNRNKVGGTVKQHNEYFVSNIYDYMLIHKEMVVVEKPGYHKLCKGCKLYHNCNELMEINAPICLGDQLIGTMSITAYTEEQREILLNRCEDYSIFVTCMCELISSKVEEVTAKDRLAVTALSLTHIINSVDECIIALDVEGRITYFNNAAEKMFMASTDEMVGQEINRWIPGVFNKTDADEKRRKKREMFYCRKDGKEVNCYVSFSQIIGKSRKPIGQILILDDAVEVKKFVGKVMGYSSHNFEFGDIIGTSGALSSVKESAEKAARTDSTVLIRGESGTGKELFARAIHNFSPRAKEPFIALNCAAIPEALLESELFGYEGGAFTGANRNGKAGKFELAEGGTLFLDEIGDMPLYLQAKLLRVLQERMIQRVGGIKETPINIRIISATNRNLEAMVKENRFREDLFYRINVIPIYIPPLRERIEDLNELAYHFIEKYNRLFGKRIGFIAPDAWRVLQSYDWPGNVRELENVLEYAMNMESGPHISEASLPEFIKKNLPVDMNPKTFKEEVSAFEKKLIEEKLALYDDSQEGKRQAAQDLGIGIATLYRKLKEYD